MDHKPFHELRRSFHFARKTVPLSCSRALTELKSVVAIRSHRTQQTRLINLTSKQKGLLKELGYEGLFDNADELWELMSAEHLASYIAAVKAQDELNAQAAQTTASAAKA